MLNRRTLLSATAAAVAAPAIARAETWPDRPIRLVVPYPPGGGTDVISREVGARLTAAKGWTVIADNRPGAGGNIGIDVVAKSPPDGYTIGMGQTSNLAINPTLYERTIPYQPLRDLTLVSLIAFQPSVFVVAKSAPWKTLAEYLAYAKASPGKATMGHPGSGTVGHLSEEMLALAAGVEVLIVPYRGAGQVIADLLAGRVDMFSANPLAVRGLLESGELRALAVTGKTRAQAMPEVPTVAESGFPDFEAVNWTGLVAPAGVPEPIVRELNAQVTAVLGTREAIARLAAEGSEPRPSTPEAFRAFLAAEIGKWGKVVRDAKVEVG